MKKCINTKKKEEVIEQLRERGYDIRDEEQGENPDIVIYRKTSPSKEYKIDKMSEDDKEKYINSIKKNFAEYLKSKGINANEIQIVEIEIEQEGCNLNSSKLLGFLRTACWGLAIGSLIGLLITFFI